VFISGKYIFFRTIFKQFLINNILELSYTVAVKVARKIVESGLAAMKMPVDIKAFVKSKMYEPIYH
jgi:malate dehydrogenase (oxaloacetate-decarboxylating)(NADP+)